MPKSNAELGAEIERLNDIVRRLGLDGEIPARTILQSNGLGGAKWYELSGTYTPTIVLEANAAAVTVSTAYYLRVGNVVAVFGRLEMDPTLAATSTLFTLSLPIASALTSITQLAGGFWSGGTATGNAGEIRGNDVDDTARFSINPVGAANVAYYYSYGYRVI